LNNDVCSVKCAGPGVNRAHNDGLAASSARQPPRAQDQLQALPTEGLHTGQDQVLYLALCRQERIRYCTELSTYRTGSGAVLSTVHTGQVQELY
jgi:hypothetical protein